MRSALTQCNRVLRVDWLAAFSRLLEAWRLRLLRPRFLAARPPLSPVGRSRSIGTFTMFHFFTGLPSQSFTSHFFRVDARARLVNVRRARLDTVGVFWFDVRVRRVDARLARLDTAGVF